MSLPQGMKALPQSFTVNFLQVPITAGSPTAAAKPPDSASSCALLPQPLLGGMHDRPLLQEACGPPLLLVEMQQGPPSAPQPCNEIQLVS